jgi:hypothetical protein|tara:strand:- start:74 stop:481 length:408 start_codon:yes stop_codon:yes gene_type:complete
VAIIEIALGVTIGLTLWHILAKLSIYGYKLYMQLRKEAKDKKDKEEREAAAKKRRKRLEDIYGRVTSNKKLQKKIDKLNQFPYTVYDINNKGKMMQLYKLYHEHVHDEIIKFLEYEDYKHVNDIMRMISVRRRRS